MNKLICAISLNGEALFPYEFGFGGGSDSYYGKHLLSRI
jgi:hypothetical protein